MTRDLDGGGGVEDGRDPAEASTPPRPPTYPTIEQARIGRAPEQSKWPTQEAPEPAPIYRKVLDILAEVPGANA